jgi:uncharacterized membrane protein YgcG
VYAGTKDAVVYKSMDRGDTWAEMNTGLPAYASVYTLVIDPITPSTLYAGTADGVYKYESVSDGGSSGGSSSGGGGGGGGGCFIDTLAYGSRRAR